MKQIYIATTTQINGQIILHANRFHFLALRNNQAENIAFDIFLNQNKGKGPPGTSGSPKAINSVPRTIPFNAITINLNYQSIINQYLFHSILN